MVGGWWGAVSSGFCRGFSGWVVGGGRRLAADFVADLADGWLVGAVSSGFCRGFSGWVVGGATVSSGFGDLPLIIRYIRYIRYTIRYIRYIRYKIRC